MLEGRHQAPAVSPLGSFFGLPQFRAELNHALAAYSKAEPDRKLEENTSSGKSAGRKWREQESNKDFPR